VCLVASFNSAHWQLSHGLKVESLALEEFDLRDDTISLQCRILARLHGDVLTLTNDLDIALDHVEKFEADSIGDLFWII